MNDQSSAIAIQILDKEYMIACPEEERDELLVSAKYLDERMKETRDGGKVLGAERMAVMTALNIVHEYLQQQREKEDTERTVSDGIRHLEDKIETVLRARRGSGESVD